MKNLEGKVVIVTGATSGIGEMAALQFASSGARVVVAARREDKEQKVVADIKNDGGEALFIKTDVTKKADILALINSTIDKFGRLDCAVNNAGVTGATLTPMAQLKRLIGTR